MNKKKQNIDIFRKICKFPFFQFWNFNEIYIFRFLKYYAKISSNYIKFWNVQEIKIFSILSFSEYSRIFWNFQQKNKNFDIFKKISKFAFFQFWNFNEISKISIFVFNLEICKKFPVFQFSEFSGIRSDMQFYNCGLDDDFCFWISWVKWAVSELVTPIQIVSPDGATSIVTASGILRKNCSNDL